MTSGSLQLFPSPPRTRPRNTSSDRARASERAQIDPYRTRPGKIQPGADHFQHSLFCQPKSPALSASTSVSVKSAQKTRRRSLELGNRSCREEDGLAPLPSQSEIHCSPTQQSKRQNNLRKRTAPPKSVSTRFNEDELHALEASEKDQLSPLPSKSQFNQVKQSPSSEYPASISPRTVRSTPSLSRSDSTASSQPPQYKGFTPPTRSIFPTYDPFRSLDQQNYYPTIASTNTDHSPEKFSKHSEKLEKPVLGRVDSAVEITNGYEHVPTAASDDLFTLWSVSIGRFPRFGRKVQLHISQAQGSEMTMSIGSSAGQPLYKMSIEKDAQKPVRHVTVAKQQPEEKSTTSAVRLELAVASPDNRDVDVHVATIFPNLAALKAIEAASDSSRAALIANLDPNGAGPETARLARRAISAARASHAAELVRSTRDRDRFGAVHAWYELRHPSLGNFAITVSRSDVSAPQAEHKAKVCLHHPSATPCAIAAEHLVLASLDFARDACTIDLPSLLALDGSYVLDTVISALFAVTAAENENIVAETMTFDPPPKTPIAYGGGKHARHGSPSPSMKSRKWLQRPTSQRTKSAKRKGRDDNCISNNDPVNDDDEVPALVRATVALLGFSLKTAVVLVEVGAKATAGLVVGASHMAKKL